MRKKWEENVEEEEEMVEVAERRWRKFVEMVEEEERGGALKMGNARKHEGIQFIFIVSLI